MGERRLDALGGIDLARAQALAQPLRRRVDEDHVFRDLEEAVRQRLAHARSGQIEDGVAEPVEVLDVQRREDRDAGAQEREYVLIPFGVPTPGGVRVRELVDEGDGGRAGEQRVEIHLAVRAARERRQPDQFRRRRDAAVRLDEARDRVDARREQPVRAIEHRVRLSRARGAAEVDRQRPVADAQSIAQRLGERRAVGAGATAPVARVDDEDVARGGAGDERLRERPARDEDQSAGNRAQTRPTLVDVQIRSDAHARRRGRPLDLAARRLAANDELEPEIERAGEARDARDVCREIVAVRDERAGARPLLGFARRAGEIVDQTQHERPQHLLRLRAEDAARERPLGVLRAHDATGADARFDLGGCGVEGDDGVRFAQERERHDLADGKADQPLGRRGNRLDVRHVERPEHADARPAQREGIFPALLVRPAGEILVRELVQDDDGGTRGQGGAEIEVVQFDCADANAPRRQKRHARRQFVQVGTAFGLDPTEHDAHAGGLQPQCFLEQAPRLPRSGRAGEKDRQSRTGAEIPEQRLGGGAEMRVAHRANVRERTPDRPGARRDRAERRLVPPRSIRPTCLALLVAAWVLDLLTPQLFVAAIFLNAPIALASLTLDRRFTAIMIGLAFAANLSAGIENGLVAGGRFDAVALADRLVSSLSFLLVGALSIATQRSAAREGAAAARALRAARERDVRRAIEVVRNSTNVELILRAATREALAVLGATFARFVSIAPGGGSSLTLASERGADEVRLERGLPSAEMRSLLERTHRGDTVVGLDRGDPLGRLLLDALGADCALVAGVAEASGRSSMLIVARRGDPFEPDAESSLRTYVDQVGVALAHARLFVELAERNADLAAANERLRERGDVIRDIVNALSHDLRTPLVAANMTARQALAGAYGPLPAAYREVLERTLRANDEVRRLAETLLMVSRYESGEASIRRERTELLALARDVLEDLAPLWRSKPLDAHVAGTEPVFIDADAGEIRRALVNVVANAVAWTPANGRVTVTIDAVAHEAFVRVGDDGFGVPEDERAQLFERVRSAPNRPGAGTGLGLYVVRRIVEHHGGSIAYAPREPRGSDFTLRFPAGKNLDP